MNMISTGAFLNEMDASNKQPSTAEKFAAVWEKKNAKAARAGGVSLMALSLAACGGSSSTTTTTTSTDTTTTTVTPVSTALTIAADAVTGTAGDDTISGARIDSLQTWNSTDTIAGGAGTDSLTAVISADVTPGTGGVTGVENLTITTTADKAVTFSTATATLISGVTSITNLGSTGELTLTRITEMADITLNNIISTEATTVTFADSVLSGTADSLTLNVNGQNGTVNIGNATSGAGTGIETLVINTSGAKSTFSAVNLDADVTTVTITGSGHLDINGAAAFAKVGTFDASAATGDIDVDFLDDGVTGATNTKTISTGSGADEVAIDNIAIAKVGAVSVSTGAGNDTVTLGDKGAVDYTIDGGAGTDTISIGAASSAATHGGISGFEKLIVTAGQAQNMLLYTGTNAWTTLQAGAASVDFTNVPATVTTLELTAGATTLATLARIVDGTADTLTIKPTAANTATTVTIDDEETVTIDSNTNSATFTNFNAEDLVTLTAVGDNNINVGAYDADTELLTTIDATGMSNANFEGDFSDADLALTVTSHTDTSNNTGTLTVTTGSAADNITGTANADTITAGGGNDTIVAGAGADTVTGGTGSDTITLGAGIDIVVLQKSGGGIDTITDFTAAGGTSDDRIKIDLIANNTNTATATASTVDADAAAIEEIGATTTETVSDNDVAVLTGDLYLDVSGNAAADLAAIQGAGGGTTMAKSDEALFIFKADTDGDGTADEVQLWYLSTDTASDTDIDTVTQLAVLGIDVSQDLASDFAVGDFDL